MSSAALTRSLLSFPIQGDESSVSWLLFSTNTLSWSGL